MILGIDHVGIAVRSGDAAAGTFARLTGWPAGELDVVASQSVRVCLLPGLAPHPDPDPQVSGPGGSRLELLEAQPGRGAVGRFIDRRGEGLHHVCFAVDDIAAELTRLTGAGFEAIDVTPRRGHEGLVAFLHPRSAHGVLVELLQRDPPRGGGES